MDRSYSRWVVLSMIWPGSLRLPRDGQRKPYPVLEGFELKLCCCRKRGWELPRLWRRREKPECESKKEIGEKGAVGMSDR